MSITRKMLNWYARLAPSHGKVTPPYDHVVQIGDPILRKVAEPVPLEKIKTPEIQHLIKKLHFVLDRYQSVGMSAPQVGVSKRIFVMKHTVKQLAAVPKQMVQSSGMTVLPFSVFINPKLKVLDYTKVVDTEGCESMQGYIAEAARYKMVQVTGYNADGQITSATFKDWAARIAQHEINHLDGHLFTDIMDRKTLTCVCWEEVNSCKGKLVIPFHPK